MVNSVLAEIGDVLEKRRGVRLVRAGAGREESRPAHGRGPGRRVLQQVFEAQQAPAGRRPAGACLGVSGFRADAPPRAVGHARPSAGSATTSNV